MAKISSTYLYHIQFIFSTFKTLGYDNHLIEKAHFRARATFYRKNQTYDNRFHNVLVLPPVCDKFTARKVCFIAGAFADWLGFVFVVSYHF